MANKVNDTLHELIKNLSKSEKRYYKVFSTRHTLGEVNNYNLLFDFINEQEYYDEEKLFSHFKGESFLNKFSITKKRLYEHIMNALDVYYSSHSIDAQLYKLLHGADILYQKALYDQSNRQLISAEKIALKHGKYNLLSEISLKKKRIVESKGISQLSEINTIKENDELYHQQSMRYEYLWNLKSQLFHILSSKGISRTEDDLTKFSSIIEDLKTKKWELNLDAQYLYNHLMSAYYYATNFANESLIYLKENLLLLESNKELIQFQPNRYFSALTNAIYLSSKLKQTDESELMLLKLKSFSEDSDLQVNEDLKIKLFASINSIELSILTLKGEFDEALTKIPFIEEGLKIYEVQLTESRKSFLYFKIATTYFSSGNFHASLKWINKIINQQTSHLQEDIISFSHILHLIIHFEMNNLDLIPYTIRSIQRFLKTKNRLYEFETLILKSISKIAKTHNKFDQELILQQFSHGISQFKGDSFQNIALEYFDFSSWAEAKLKNLNYSELIKQKYNQVA
jgi:hypothetical protein